MFLSANAVLSKSTGYIPNQNLVSFTVRNKKYVVMHSAQGKIPKCLFMTRARFVTWSSVGGGGGMASVKCEAIVGAWGLSPVESLVECQ